ncbi:MAG TPA: FAD-dependent oxidoreductase [Terracidiphilus sp.]|nr:FAD-dependent oxidoreductase [Terracidiphilus sp.]
MDFLVMGAGVAGLRAAVELARHGDVLVVTKESVAESNTHYAQGGIAVAMEGDQDIALHLEDTERWRWAGLSSRSRGAGGRGPSARGRVD